MPDAATPAFGAANRQPVVIARGEQALVYAICHILVKENIRIFVEIAGNARSGLHSGLGMPAWFPVAEVRGAALLLPKPDPMLIAAAKFSRGDHRGNVWMGEQVGDFVEICGNVGAWPQIPQSNRSKRPAPGGKGPGGPSFAYVSAK